MMSNRWIKSLTLGRQKRKKIEEDAKLQAWIHRQELLDRTQPPIIQQPRVRDLEHPLQEPQKIRGRLQKTSLQLKSHLVQLPAELQLKIYDLLYANHTIHIFAGYWPGDWRGGRQTEGDVLPWGWSDYGRPERTRLFIQNLPHQWHFYHSICTTDERFAPVAPHWHCAQIDDRPYVKPHEMCMYQCRYDNVHAWSREPYHTQTLQVMSMLLSCRLIYTDVVHHLYTQNTFVFMKNVVEHLMTANHIPQPVCGFELSSKFFLPQHFALIRSLDLEMRPQGFFPTDNPPDLPRGSHNLRPQFYNKWWDIIASMPNLRHLTVYLDFTIYDPINDEVCQLYLEPMNRLKVNKALEFHLAVQPHTFRLFKRNVDPAYTSLSFFKDNATIHGNPLLERWVMDEAYSWPEDEGTWYPITSRQNILDTDET